MVDRYFPDIKWVAAQPFRRMGIDNEIEGGYVIYRDYAKLEAENKRLKEFASKIRDILGRRLEIKDLTCEGSKVIPAIILFNEAESLL